MRVVFLIIVSCAVVIAATMWSATDWLVLLGVTSPSSKPSSSATTSKSPGPAASPSSSSSSPSGSRATYFERVFGFTEDREYEAARARFLSFAQFSDPSPSSIAHGMATPAEDCVLTLDLGDRTTAEVHAGVFVDASVAELHERLSALLEDASVREAVDLYRNADTVRKRHAIRFDNVVGDSRALHSVPAYAGGVFQAASQFNYLEFPSPQVTPEMGITAYQHDRTQGPACAIACAAGTAYRNYLLPMEEADSSFDGRAAADDAARRGQQKHRQRNGLVDIDRAFVDMLAQKQQKSSSTSASDAPPPKLPWRVKNGYIEASPNLLAEANTLLTKKATRDRLRPLLRVGIQEDTDVLRTDAAASPGTVLQRVTQVYCSAVSVGYSRCRADTWEPLATLVLEASYEATFLVAAFKAAQAIVAGKPPPPLLLTKVGGGVFGNEAGWIQSANKRAAKVTAKYGVPFEALVVHYGHVEAGYEDRVVRGWNV